MKAESLIRATSTLVEPSTCPPSSCPGHYSRRWATTGTLSPWALLPVGDPSSVNALASVIDAFSNLAASVNALASVIDVATGRLRQQLALDDAMPVIEHHPAEEPDSATANGKGRKSKASVA
jgi:hypothetical protein